MSGIAVILLIFIVACYVGQNFFTKLYSEKYSGDVSISVPVFAIFYGLIVGISTLFYNKCSLQPDLTTLLMGLGNGAALFMYNITYIKASQTGPYSFQTLMQSFGNLIIPLVLNITLWGESLKVVTTIGLILMFGALFVFNAGGFHFTDARKGYWIWVILLFMANGIYSELIDAQHRIEKGALRQEMIIITYLTTAVIAAAYLLIRKNKNFFPSFRIGKKSAFFMFLASLCAAIAINLLMITLQYVSSTILYPASTGALMVINALLGAFVLHEKFTKWRVMGIACAVASLVLLNL